MSAHHGIPGHAGETRLSPRVSGITSGGEKRDYLGAMTRPPYLAERVLIAGRKDIFLVIHRDESLQTVSLFALENTRPIEENVPFTRVRLLRPKDGNRN